jgi:glutamate synthase domain-containing protein 3
VYPDRPADRNRQVLVALVADVYHTDRRDIARHHPPFPKGAASMFTIQCQGKPTRDINRELRAAVTAGHREIQVLEPDARHNLAVALLQPVRVVFEGSVGYYCAGLMDGGHVEVRGSAGWGTAESMMDGTVVIDGNAGSGVAASIRGGVVVVRGDAAARAGVSMKGGTLLIGGSCGYMAGFMMQKGRIVICGDAGDALADSMYEGVVYVGGRVASLGNDAVIQEPTDEDRAGLSALLTTYRVPAPAAFRKVVSGRKLWNFDRKELEVWKAAL